MLVEEFRDVDGALGHGRVVHAGPMSATDDRAAEVARVDALYRDAPVLIRIETRAGHGAGKPTTKLIEERADAFAFLTWALGMALPAGFGETDRAPQ